MAKKTQEQIAYYKTLAKLQKACDEVSDWMIPQLYACFIKILYDEYGFDQDSIEDLVGRTQELWYESLAHIGDLVDWCNKTTGIDLRMVPNERIDKE